MVNCDLCETNIHSENFFETNNQIQVEHDVVVCSPCLGKYYAMIGANDKSNGSLLKHMVKMNKK